MIGDRLTNERLTVYIRKRLICPLVLAERGVIKCMYTLKDEQLVKQVQTFGQQIQDEYWQQITHHGIGIHWDLISASLSYCLNKYYKGIPKLLPISAYDCLDCVIDHAVSIPSDAWIDWEQLVYRFLALEGEQERPFTFVPPDLLETHKTFAFLNVCQQLNEEGKTFDEEIMWRSWQRYFNILAEYCRLMYERYWELYDQPPLYQQLNRLQYKIALLRFRYARAEIIGVSSTSPDTLEDIFDKESYVEFIREDLKLHELKEKELIALKRLEDNVRSIEQIVQKDDLSTLSTTPAALAIAPEQCVGIISALEPYISSGLSAFKSLLAGGKPDEVIVFRGRPTNSLIYVFTQAKDAEHINDPKTVIARWLVYWFRIEEKGIVLEMSYKTVLDVLSKKKTRPAKSRRLPYQP